MQQDDMRSNGLLQGMLKSEEGGLSKKADPGFYRTRRDEQPG